MAKSTKNRKAPKSSAKRKKSDYASRAKAIATDLIKSGQAARDKEHGAREADYLSVERAVERANELRDSKELWNAFVGLEYWTTKGARPTPAKRHDALRYVLRMLRKDNKEANVRLHAVQYLLELQTPLNCIAAELAAYGGYRGIEKEIRDSKHRMADRSPAKRAANGVGPQHREEFPAGEHSRKTGDGPIMLQVVTQSASNAHLLGLQAGQRKLLTITVLKTKKKQHVWRIEDVSHPLTRY